MNLLGIQCTLDNKFYNFITNRKVSNNYCCIVFFQLNGISKHLSKNTEIRSAKVVYSRILKKRIQLVDMLETKLILKNNIYVYRKSLYRKRKL